MVVLKSLEDITDLGIMSLQEVIDVSRPQVKPRYKSWIQIERKLVEGGKAPSLSAYLLYEHHFNGKTVRDLASEFEVSYTRTHKLFSVMGIPIRKSKLKPGVFKLSEAELRKLYIDDKLNSNQIAKRLGVGQTSIFRWLDEYSIERKSATQARLKDGFKPSDEQLRIWYVNERNGIYNISKRCGVDPGTIHRWLRKIGVKMRKGPDAHFSTDIEIPSKAELEEWYFKDLMNVYEIAEMLDVGRTTVYRWFKNHNLELRDLSSAVLVPRGIIRPSDEKLKELYLDKMMSCTEISELVNVSLTTVTNWLEGLGVERRPPEEYYSGENHPNFNNWSSIEPYSIGFMRVMRPYVRERDNHECQDCGKEENGRVLCVHHIDYDKTNDSEFNLISLCNSCHGQTNPLNEDREVWKGLYREKVREIYLDLSSKRLVQLRDYRKRLEEKLARVA